MIHIKLFSTLVKHIYNLSHNIRGIRLLLQEVKEQFDSRSLGIHIIDREGLHVISELVSDTEEQDLQRYAEHFHTLRPHLSSIRESESRTCAKEIYVFKHEQLSRLEHANSLFFADASTPKAFSLLFREGTYLVQVALLDEYNDESAYKKLVRNVSLLRPHIHNAFEIFHELEQLKAKEVGYTQTMDQLHSGIILFDGNGESIFLNRRAKKMMGQTPYLSVISGKVVGSKSAITKSLHHIIHNAIHAGMGKSKNIGAVTIQTLNENLIAIAIPMHPDNRTLVEKENGIYAALMIGSAEQPEWLNPEVLQVLFHLTPAEAKLAVALSSGTSLNQYSELSGTSISTIRSYLKLVFQKTDTNRQAELVALLRSIPTL